MWALHWKSSGIPCCIAIATVHRLKLAAFFSSSQFIHCSFYWIPWSLGFIFEGNLWLNYASAKIQVQSNSSSFQWLVSELLVFQVYTLLGVETGSNFLHFLEVEIGSSFVHFRSGNWIKIVHFLEVETGSSFVHFLGMEIGSSFVHFLEVETGSSFVHFLEVEIGSNFLHFLEVETGSSFVHF